MLHFNQVPRLIIIRLCNYTASPDCHTQHARIFRSRLVQASPGQAQSYSQTLQSSWDAECVWARCPVLVGSSQYYELYSLKVTRTNPHCPPLNIQPLILSLLFQGQLTKKAASARAFVSSKCNLTFMKGLSYNGIPFMIGQCISTCA